MNRPVIPQFPDFHMAVIEGQGIAVGMPCGGRVQQAEIPLHVYREPAIIDSSFMFVNENPHTRRRRLDVLLVSENDVFMLAGDSGSPHPAVE